MSRRYVSNYCKYILYLSVNENRSFLKSMLLNHTKTITKQEEGKRAEQRKYAREEVRDEVIKEVWEEMRDEVREEIREEACRNTEWEKENIIKAIVSLCCEYGRSQEQAAAFKREYALSPCQYRLEKSTM